MYSRLCSFRIVLNSSPEIFVSFAQDLSREVFRDEAHDNSFIFGLYFG